MTMLTTPAPTTATEPGTYYLKEIVDETLSDESATKYLGVNISRILDYPEPAEVFGDLIDSEPCRSIGCLAYRPDTGKWNLGRYGTWSVEDQRVAAQALKRIKRMGTPTENDAFCTKLVTPKGFTFLSYRIARPLSDLRIHEVFNAHLPTPHSASMAPFIDPVEVDGTKTHSVTQDDVSFMFDCHDEAMFEGHAEIADDPRPVEIFRCTKTNRIMRRIGVSRFDETTGKFLAVAFEGATGLDHARIWCAPGFGIDKIFPLGLEALAATTIHTREDGSRYADVSIARPLDDCNADELAGIAHDLFELASNPCASSDPDTSADCRVFLKVIA